MTILLSDPRVAAVPVHDRGEPLVSLGGRGLDVGASVRDLGGYAAEGVPPCDVVQVSVHLHDPAAGGTVAGALQAQSAPQTVPGASGRGELVAVDWSTWAASLPASARGGELHEQAAWLVTLVDPQPGSYRLAGQVTAVGGGPSGGVEVVVTVAPSS